MPRRSRLLATLALATALVAFPLGALASHDFADVPDSNLFHADISALVDSGVTSGCGGGNYCPSANVTREQMAAFLNRLGALAPGKTPVVNAALLDGLDSTDFLQIGPVRFTDSAPWLPDEGTSFVIGYPTGRTRITVPSTASDDIRLRLTRPNMVSNNNVAYGLSSVEVCWAGTTTQASIDKIEVFGASNFGVESLAIDETGWNSAGGCATVNMAQPEYTYDVYDVVLTVTIQTAGNLALTGTAALWEPVTT